MALAPVMAGTLAKVPLYLTLDHMSRSAFCRFFYAGYRGMKVDRLIALAPALFETEVKPRLYSVALRQIADHRDRGHRIVLLTGSLDFIMQPLAEFLGADDLVAARLNVSAGRFTGTLDSEPLTDTGKAEAVFRFARAHDIDYRNSFAYGDSISDLPMLECVGHPNAVNPDRRLRAVAEQRGWPIHQWLAA